MGCIQIYTYNVVGMLVTPVGTARSVYIIMVGYEMKTVRWVHKAVCL